jgi:hypothetical protein
MRYCISHFAALLILALNTFAEQPSIHLVLANGDSLVNVSVDSVCDMSFFVSVEGVCFDQPVTSLIRVYCEEPGSQLRSAVIGAFACASAGFLIGEILDMQHEREMGYNDNAITATRYKVVLPIVGGVVGGSIGVIMSHSRHLSVFDLTGRSAEEKRRFLVSLAKKGGS